MDNINEFHTYPDWSTAPDWAQWWALDKTGDAYWYEEKPYNKRNWCWLYKKGNIKIAHHCGSKEVLTPNWQNSLQQRPDNA